MNERRLRSSRRAARRHLEQLADEIDALPPSATGAAQAMDCLLLGAAAVETGETVKQIGGGGQLAIAGLHLTRKARAETGVDPGPEPAALKPAPKRSRRTPHHYPDTRGLALTADAEWPIPAGWYADPWWHAVMTTGNEGAGPGLGSMMLFDEEFPS